MMIKFLLAFVFGISCSVCFSQNWTGEIDFEAKYHISSGDTIQYVEVKFETVLPSDLNNVKFYEMQNGVQVLLAQFSAQEINSLYLTENNLFHIDIELISIEQSQLEFRVEIETNSHVFSKDETILFNP